MRFHPVGYRIIIFFLLILALINTFLFFVMPSVLSWLMLFVTPSFVLMILILRFFRYPLRLPAQVSGKTLLAPADGKIVVIEEVYDDRFLKGKAIQISTFMSAHNVHLNWVPVDAVATEVVYLPGEYLLARNPKSSMLNEMSCVLFTTAEGHRIVVKQIAGVMARRVLPFLKQGIRYKRGDELGFIRFGSRVDVLLPPDSKVLVRIGDRPRGMKTALAELP
jgi:phosphatidylserine decarboxylase